jgi:hypothetical protein
MQTAEFVVENSEHVAMRLQKKAEKEARMEALKASRTGPQQQVQNHAAAAAALREKKRSWGCYCLHSTSP